MHFFVLFSSSIARRFCNENKYLGLRICLSIEFFLLCYAMCREGLFCNQQTCLPWIISVTNLASTWICVGLFKREKKQERKNFKIAFYLSLFEQICQLLAIRKGQGKNQHVAYFYCSWNLFCSLSDKTLKFLLVWTWWISRPWGFLQSRRGRGNAESGKAIAITGTKRRSKCLSESGKKLN